MNKIFFVICLILFGSAFSAHARLFDISEYTLSNGIKLLVVPNHKAPIVKHMVWYNVGAVDEKPGKGGSAHLLEHLMFRGTKNIPGSEFNRILQQNGADSNAFTSQDFTAYHQNLDISRLELAMYMEADRMQNLKFSPTDFETERDIVFQERKQVVENQPLSAFSENMQRSLWQDHPYANPVSGTETEILNLTPDDVMDIYRRYYAPGNAVVVLAGDIEPETAYRLAEKYYGKVPPRDIGSRIVFPDMNPTLKSRLSMELPRVELPRIVRRYMADSYNTDAGRIYALAVLSRYLGEGDTSALYKELVIRRELALDVSSSYNYASRSYGSFNIAAVPQNGVSVEELQQALDEAVADAVDAIDDEKITKIKNKMLAGLIYLKDNPFDAAYIVGSLYSIGMSREDIENYADNIRKVSADDVREAAQQLLKNYAVAEGVAKPQSREKAHD